NMDVQITGEALGFVRQHFHLSHVGSKKRQVIFNEDAQLGQWIADSSKTLLEAFEHSSKAIVLNKKQQLFFRFAVVVETGEAYVGRPRNVAHGGGVIILLGKDARRVAQDKL